MHLLICDLASVGNVILADEVSRNFELYEINTNFGTGARKMFRHKWKNFGTILFFFIVFVSIVPWLIQLRFFTCGSRLILKFSLIALLLNRLQLVSTTKTTKRKGSKTTKGMSFDFFLLEKASFLQYNICMVWKMQKLLIFDFLLTTWSLFDNYFGG